MCLFSKSNSFDWIFTKHSHTAQRPIISREFDKYSRVSSGAPELRPWNSLKLTKLVMSAL